MSNCSIALIAEDETDCDTLRKIVHRVLGTKTKTKSWASKGCSTLRRKLSAKLNLLSKQGCNAFIILHDLDRNPLNNSLNDEAKLRQDLASKASVANRVLICIPIEELEAWFWSDPAVVEHIGRGIGQANPNPGLIIKPKEKLINLSSSESRKPRYSTNMNVGLAEILDLKLCSDRCPSFKCLLQFLHSL